MLTQFTSPDIHCEKCAGRVRQALGQQPGIMTVSVDPAAHRVEVDFDDSKISRGQIKAALTEAGYPPTE